MNVAAKRAETISTYLGQQVDATVTEFTDSPLRFDQLVQAINEGERILGVPYPSPRVTMKRVSKLSGGFCGHNRMSYLARYSGDLYVVDGSIIEVRVDADCDETFATIAHEVAHTWFHGNEPTHWIDEGLADAIEHQLVAAYHNRQQIYPPITYCESYANVRELEGGAPDRVSNDQPTGFRCNYRLGDGIFGELSEYYGDIEFNQRIAQLARRQTNETDREHTIANIRGVLGGNGPALEIIDRWYDGQPEMRKYLHLDAVGWSFPPTIDGDYLHFAGKTNQPGVVQDFVLGQDPYCSQFPLYDDTDDREWVASVSDPLPAGWHHDEMSKVITVNHRISPSSGEFSVTAKIDSNALANIRDLSLSVRSRVTTGEDGLCSESINYSQVPVVSGTIPSDLKAHRFYHLDAIQWTYPPMIDGDYLHFGGRTNQLGMLHDFVLGDDPYCSQFALYRNINNPEWVANVSDPLLAGRSYGESAKVVVVDHHISSDNGEFSVTARINDNALSNIDELSLLVRSRVTADGGGGCVTEDIYSQVPVVTGRILDEINTSRHYSLDAVQWIDPPTMSGNSLRFAGKASPGAVGLTWQEGYCSQFHFYYSDEGGYHYIDSMNLLLPENRHWTGLITGEVTEQQVHPDGTFEALVKLSENALARYRNPVLLVKARAAVDSGTNQCSESDVLSAADIR